MRGPKFYSSLEEFQREEIRPHQKLGWSLDDLYQEAAFTPGEESYSEEPQELDFE